MPKGQTKWTIQRNWQQGVTQDEEKQNKNTAQYVLDTTMRKQIRHKPSYKRRNEHRFYAEIVTDITTRNSDVTTHNRTAQKTKRMSNTDPK